MAGPRPYRPRKYQGLHSGNLVGFDLGKPIAMFAYVENNGPCFSGFSRRSEPADLYLCVHMRKDKDQGPCSNRQVGRKGGRRGGTFLGALPFVLLKPPAGGRTPVCTGIQTLI